MADFEETYYSWLVDNHVETLPPREFLEVPHINVDDIDDTISETDEHDEDDEEIGSDDEDSDSDRLYDQNDDDDDKNGDNDTGSTSGHHGSDSKSSAQVEDEEEEEVDLDEKFPYDEDYEEEYEEDEEEEDEDQDEGGSEDEKDEKNVDMSNVAPPEPTYYFHTLINCFQHRYLFIRCIYDQSRRKAYLVQDRKTKKLQVIIIVRPRKSQPEVRVPTSSPNKIPREVFQLAKARGHPNILHLLAWCPLWCGTFALLFPYYRNFDLVDANGKDLYSIQRVLRQLVSAVQHLHRVRISHRDLAVANIMYDPITENLTVIDLAEAAPIREAKYYVITGRTEYNAPEKTRILREKEDAIEHDDITHRYHHQGYDERADMYSIGVIAYMLLMGDSDEPDERDIYQYRKTMMTTKKKLVAKRPEIQFVLGLLEPDPKQRLTADQALQHTFLKQNIKPSAEYNSRQIKWRVAQTFLTDQLKK